MFQPTFVLDLWLTFSCLHTCWVFIRNLLIISLNHLRKGTATLCSLAFICRKADSLFLHPCLFTYTSKITGGVPGGLQLPVWWLWTTGNASRVFESAAICIQNLCVENCKAMPGNASKKFCFKVMNMMNIFQKSQWQIMHLTRTYLLSFTNKPF